MESERFVIKLRETALAVLKRPLTVEEENQFLSYQSASGRGDDLGDLLYMLLVCHQAATKVEDQAVRLETQTNVAVSRITKALSEYEKLKKEINTQFVSTIRDAAETAMQENVENMKTEMAEHAKKILEGEKEFLRLRIVLTAVLVLGIIAAFSYTLGALNVVLLSGSGGSKNPLSMAIGAVVNIKIGWWMIFVTAVWGSIWVYENWQNVKSINMYRLKAIGVVALWGFLLLAIYLA